LGIIALNGLRNRPGRFNQPVRRERCPDVTDAALEQPINVIGQGGVAGEFDFTTRSSVGRELVFLASHAIHHYALLQVYCAQHGVVTDPHFGTAPSTVANELRTNAEKPSTTSTREFA
jgi:hypothetical protein